MRFWFKRQSRRFDGVTKKLAGSTLWVRRLVSGPSVEAASRKYILLWNGSANVAANMVGGNFLVGLYTVIHLSDLLLGLLTTVIQACNIMQILSPLLLDRFKYKKGILLFTRILYYSLYIIVIGFIPFVSAEDGMRVGLLMIVMIAANLINALAAPGYSVLHIRSIPVESRADFFSVLSLLNNICIYIFILLGGYVVDFFRNRGSFAAGLTAVRIIGLAFAALEIYAHCHVHEFDEPPGEGENSPDAETGKTAKTAPKRPQNPFSCLRNKEFMICAVLMGLYNFFANIPGVYYSSYLIKTVEVPYSYLGIVNFLSVPIMLIAVPVWNTVIRKISWFKTIAVSLFLVAFHYFMLTFVGRGNYLYLYTFAVIYYFFMIPGVNIVAANLPYYRLPEGGRTAYLAFFSGFQSFMAMLGLSAGSVFIAATEGFNVSVSTWILGNKQLIMPFTGLLLLFLAFIYRYIAVTDQKAADAARLRAEAAARHAAALDSSSDEYLAPDVDE